MGEAVLTAIGCLAVIALIGLIIVKFSLRGAEFHTLMITIVIFFALGFEALLGGLVTDLEEGTTTMVKKTGVTKTYEIQTDEEGNYDIKKAGSNLSIPIKSETGTDTWFIPSKDVEIKDSSGEPILMEYNSDGITRYELYIDKKILYMDK